MRVGQVVTREINERVVHGVNELRLRGDVISVFHRVSGVDDVHLGANQKTLNSRNATVYCRTDREREGNKPQSVSQSRHPILLQLLLKYWFSFAKLIRCLSSSTFLHSHFH